MCEPMKSSRFKSINWVAEFEPINGSYYDYVAEIYSPSEAKEKDICNELLKKGWRKIETGNGILVFEKDRHVIRIFPIWDR
jgi:hypothetical protein